MGTVHAKSDEHTKNQSHLTHEATNRDTKEILLDGIKARVDKIHVDGLSRTKDDIIQDCLKDVFKASNMQDVLLRAHQARVKLDELYCFKNIAVFIDTSKGPEASPDGLEVTFNVKEFNRIVGGINTSIGNNEGNLMVAVRAPNLCGRGERVQVEYSYGSKNTTNFNVAYIKPLRGPHRPLFSTSLFQSHAEWPVSGYKHVDRGLLFDFGFNSKSFIKHNLQWEVAVRDLGVLSRTTAFDIREQSGVSLKSALKHILTMDMRDDIVFPTSGSLLKITSEMAGLGGDVGYLKNDIYLQGNYSIVDDITLQGCLMVGFLNSLNNDMKIGPPDRCYMGGPQTVRGFQMRGIGPHIDGDALGASAFWASGLHLFTPLPFRPGRGGFGDLFKTHLFVTAGNIGDFRLDDPNFAEILTRNMRISYGMGIALRLGGTARVEINYCFPHIYEKSDRTQAGVQFGVGVQFL